ncbi:hypothetical protein F4778DRAFT_527505 [Xylariomycetidae sp. FL2044]|nr:hypothetical protein F4778DRAFT_527505 [Xylariomycetidae sp. FL2044]
MSSNRKDEDEGGEEQAFLAPRPPAQRDDYTWPHAAASRGGMQKNARLGIEIAMAVIIGVLLASLVYERVEVRRTPVPRFPRKLYKFLPNSTYVRDDMLFDEHETLHTLHNWIPLSADARGYVQIPDREAYDVLADPYTVEISRNEDGPAYMVSVFHQLHCLSYVVEHYQQGYGGAALTDEVAHHSAHCFDYLRQAIMCAADTNLEGETEAGPGWGSDHECTDYDALLAWANKHGARAWRNALLPGESIL